MKRAVRNGNQLNDRTALVTELEPARFRIGVIGTYLRTYSTYQRITFYPIAEVTFWNMIFWYFFEA